MKRTRGELGRWAVELESSLPDEVTVAAGKTKTSTCGVCGQRKTSVRKVKGMSVAACPVCRQVSLPGVS